VGLCVANVLGIPVESIRTEGADTFTFSSGSMTGGSGTSESACHAAIQAATTLKGRLQPYMDKGNNWVQAITAASASGVNLNAMEWFAGSSFRSGTTYGVFGTAITEVMLDVLTGEVRVERVDILMDLGNQLDAAVDIGQVQGAFVMVLGYLFTEQVLYDPVTAVPLCLGTWEYKVPTAYDIPVVFNTALLKNTPNPHAVTKSSKAVAEPAMMLVSCPYLAVKDAIYAARTEVGHTEDWIPLDVPLTVEAVRTAIDVPPDQMVMP